MASDVNTTSRLRIAVENSGATVTRVDHMEFDVALPEGVVLNVVVNLGVVRAVEVMPGGTIIGEVEFSRLATGIVTAALLAMLSEMGA